jgi:MoaA/NifB/PqqE/SkfB family radical SAM enzyme
MKSRSRSHTSNNAKLFKHLGALQCLQAGIVTPILVHIAPTHKCQMNCVFCCFKNRKGKTLDLSFEAFKVGMKQFYELGTRAIEFTGGGEPTLWPYINEAIVWLKNMGFSLGINTNAVDSQLVKYWDLFTWVRISLNVLDYHDSINLGPIKNAGAYFSGCYIWNDLSTPEILERVAQFANKEKLASRIAPDCIVKLDAIDTAVEVIRKSLKVVTPSEFMFLSDFNVDTYRHNQKCFIHLIKPFFYTDGYIYPCPSLELAVENDVQLPGDFKLCRHDEVIDFYQNGRALDIQDKPCSYCKYAKQQVVLDDILTETEFNAFA